MRKGFEGLYAAVSEKLKADVRSGVRTINEVPGKFVRTLAAVRDQKQAA